MNDRKNHIAAKVKPKHWQKVRKYISDNPNGIRFTDLKEALKMPDTTLTRNLDYIVKEGYAVRAGNLYLPPGGNIALNIFRESMRVIEESVRLAHYTERGKKQSDGNANKDSEKQESAASGENMIKVNPERLKIVVDEIAAADFKYHSMPNDGDLLTLARLLKYTVMGTLTIPDIEAPLSGFIARAITYRAERGDETKEPPVRVLREVEEYLFGAHGVLEGIEKGETDAVWLNVYEALCRLNDRQIPVILNRILEEAEKGDHDFRTIRHAIRNSLWCGKMKESLQNMQFNLFQKQLKNSTKPELSGFYSALRKMVMDSAGSTSERGYKDN